MRLNPVFEAFGTKLDGYRRALPHHVRIVLQIVRCILMRSVQCRRPNVKDYQQQHELWRQITHHTCKYCKGTHCLRNGALAYLDSVNDVMEAILIVDYE